MKTECNIGLMFGNQWAYTIEIIKIYFMFHRFHVIEICWTETDLIRDIEFYVRLREILSLYISNNVKCRLQALAIGCKAYRYDYVSYTFKLYVFLHIRPLGAAGALAVDIMYMFSRHQKLDFCKIISFISGLECLQKLR